MEVMIGSEKIRGAYRKINPIRIEYSSEDSPKKKETKLRCRRKNLIEVELKPLDRSTKLYGYKNEHNNVSLICVEGRDNSRYIRCALVIGSVEDEKIKKALRIHYIRDSEEIKKFL